MGGTYTEPVSFRVETELSQKLSKFADAEHRKVADLARLLLNWAADRYEETGSLHVLFGSRLLLGEQDERTKTDSQRETGRARRNR